VIERDPPSVFALDVSQVFSVFSVFSLHPPRFYVLSVTQI
jgi:hypothetical protein